MQYTSATYNSIFQNQKYRVETKVEVYESNGVQPLLTFRENAIVSCSVSNSMFSENHPCAGSCCASEIDLSFYAGDYDIPRMARIQPYIRLVGEIRDGTILSSEWLPKGVFWIDTRSTDKASGVTTIHGYDAMLKGEQLFEPDGVVDHWPRTDLQVLEGFEDENGVWHDGVADKMGVTFGNRQTWDIDKGYIIQYTGTTQGDGNAEAGFTVREVLGYICAMYGMNAVVGCDGTLMLLPFAKTTISQNIDYSMASLEISPEYEEYGQVEVVTSERESIIFPETATGRKLTVYSPWGVQSGQNVAQNIYNEIEGYVYVPFIADKAVLNPALELGDNVRLRTGDELDRTVLRLSKLDLTFNAAFRMDVESPQDDEVDHEYPFVSREKREVDRIKATTQASLAVMADAIEAKVSNDEMQSAITQTAGEILAEVASDYYGKQTSVSITPQGLTVNSDGSITLSAGATFTISSGNFSIDENGNVNVAGTLSAARVYASNLVTGSGGGSIGSAQNLLTHLYASGITTNTLHSVSEESSSYKVLLGSDVMATIGATGITPAGQSVITWAEMRGGGGGTAVFG